jgi:peroxiredoxin
MTASLCLLGCLLAPAQTPERPTAPAARAGEWVIVPRLSKAQELVYRGTFTEEAVGGNVQFNRTFRLESRIFVLDTPVRGAEVAFLTVLKGRDPRTNAATAGGDAAAESVRLDLAHVDLQGVVTAEPGTSLTVPLDGPPTLECGAFAAVPEGKFAADSTWETAEEGRPTRVWRALGSDMVNGVRCLKLEGVQKSDDWDKPRADRAAWRRTDLVWLAPRLGVACRVDRVIERRESGRRDPTYKSVLRYDQEEPMQYPGRLYDERQREIVQAHAFSEAATPLLSTPAKHGPQLSALLNRIAYHLDRQPQTPYREAIFQVKRRVEAAQRGETPPVLASDDKPETPAVATVGAAAPDFLAPNLVTSGTFRLRQERGKPVLLVFYNPASPTTAGVLAYGQKMSDAYSKDLTVLALSVSGDADAVKKQRADLKLTIPVLDGSGLHTSYGVEGTPKLMLLDGNGVLRGDYVGWGSETPGAVMNELRRWGPKR